MVVIETESIDEVSRVSQGDIRIVNEEALWIFAVYMQSAYHEIAGAERQDDDGQKVPRRVSSEQSTERLPPALQNCRAPALETAIRRLPHEVVLYVSGVVRHRIPRRQPDLT